MKFQTIESLIYYIAQYIDYIPILLFIIYFQKCKFNKGLWIIISGCIFSIIIVKLVETATKPAFKHYLISFYTLSEYLIFALFLWISLKSKLFKKILIAASIPFFLFLIIYSIQIKFARFDTLPIGIETILVLVFSFCFLYEQMNESKDQFIYQDYRFWVILGMMTYLAGSFFIYIYAEQFNIEEWKKYRFLTLVFYILKNIFFTIGIIVHARHSNRNTSKEKSIPYLDIN